MNKLNLLIFTILFTILACLITLIVIPPGNYPTDLTAIIQPLAYIDAILIVCSLVLSVRDKNYLWTGGLIVILAFLGWIITPRAVGMHNINTFVER